MIDIINIISMLNVLSTAGATDIINIILLNNIYNSLNVLKDLIMINSYFFKNINMYNSSIIILLSDNENIKSMSILDMINVNYFSNPWKNYLNNNIELWMMKNILSEIDDKKIYVYIYNIFLKKILYIIEIWFLILENIYIEFFLQNNIINFFFWYFYENYLLEDFYKFNINNNVKLCHSILLEMLYEMESNYLVFKLLRIYDIWPKNYYLTPKSFGMYHDFKVNHFFIKKNFFNNLIKSNNLDANNNNFLFFRKNIINKIVLNDTYYLKPYLKNILSAKDVFDNASIFEKLTHKYKYKYNASLFWYKHDHWLFGRSNKSFFTIKNSLQKNIINFINYINNKNVWENSNIIWNSKLRFFGGYSNWFYWFQDYKLDNERVFYKKNIQQLFLHEIKTYKLVRKRNIFFDRNIRVWRPFVESWRTWKIYYNKNFEVTSRLYYLNINKFLKNFILSNDIFFTKKLFIENTNGNINFTDNYINVIMKKKKLFFNKKFNSSIFKKNYNTDLWIKQILIKKPVLLSEFYYKKKAIKILKLYEYKERFFKKKIIFFNFMNFKFKTINNRSLNFIEESFIEKLYICEKMLLKKSLLKVQKYMDKVNLRFIKFLSKKQPYIFRTFKHEYLYKKHIVNGFFNIFYKKILKISHRGIFLLQKSQNYSNDLQKTIQGFWVKEYTKDILNANRVKYFLKDKIMAKKIFFKERYYTVGDKYKIWNYVIKKSYWTNYNIFSKDNIYYSGNEFIKLSEKIETLNTTNYIGKGYFKQKNLNQIKNYYWEFFFKKIIIENFLFDLNLKDKKYVTWKNILLKKCLKSEIINWYYNIYNLNIKLLNRNILLKIEYLQNYINIFEEEKKFYYDYFFFKTRKKYVISIINNIFNFISKFFDNYENVIYFLKKNNYILLWFLFFLIILFYFILCLFIVAILRSKMPINSIYGLKNIFKKEKKSSKRLKEFFEKELNIIMKEDITFGTEQRFIYSLTEKNNIWVKKNIYNIYTTNFNKKKKENYDVLYKKLKFEERIQHLENNKKYKIPFYLWLYYFVVNKNRSPWINFWGIVLKYYNDRFYNHGITLKKDMSLNWTLFIYNLKIPEIKFLKKIWFYIKFFLGIGSIWVKINNRRFLRRFNRRLYYETLQNNIIDDKKYERELRQDVANFIRNLKKNATLEWFKKEMNFNKNDILNKNYKFNQINWEINNSILDENISFHIKIYNFLLKNYEINDENIKIKKKNILIWNKILSYYKERDDIYTEYLSKYNKNISNLKNFSFSMEDLEKENFRFKLWCIDYLIFKSLLEVLEDNIDNVDIKNLLKKKIQNFFIENEKKINQIDWFVKEQGSNTIFYEKKRLGRDNLVRDINNDLQIFYRVYRWFTSIGARFYYLLSLIITITTIWFNSINKIKKGEHNISTLYKIFIFDIQKFIKKIYWEYVLIFNSNKISKFVFIKIRDILFFLIIIISPLFFYISTLILFFIIYIYIYYIYIWIKKILNNLIFVKYKNNLIFLYNFYIIFIFIYNLFRYFFIDIKTGQTLFKRLYIKLFIYLTNIQNCLFFIEGAYSKGKSEKNWLLGIKYVLKWFYLKYKVYQEDFIFFLKKKNKTKKMKNYIILKISLLWFFIKKKEELRYLMEYYIDLFIFIIYELNNKYFILYWIDKNYFLYLFKNWIYDVYVKFVIILEKIKKNIYNIYMLYKNAYIKSNEKEKKKLIIQIITTILMLPIIIVIYFIYWLIYQIFFKSWEENYIKFFLTKKLDKVLKTSVFSNYIYTQKINKRPWVFENFLIKKARRYKKRAKFYQWGKINVKPRHIINWNNIYVNFLNIKDHFWNYGYDLVYKIESIYIEYSKSGLTARWSPYKRLWIIIRKLLKKELNWEKHVINKQEERSRNKFFYKKWKMRNKFIRSYFIKGLINWIVYILFGKVIFTKIKELKEQKIRVNLLNYRYYKIKNISSSFHLPFELEKVPPQLWLLCILYDIYCQGIVFYILYNEKPLYYNSLDKLKDLKHKWRINPNLGDIDFYGLSKIGYWDYLFSGQDFYKHACDKKPKHIGWRFLLYFIEWFGLEGWSKKKLWSDISFYFGSTYDSKKKILKYENKYVAKSENERLENLYLNKDFHAYNEYLILERFNRELRLKNAFILKISFDYMHKDSGINQVFKKKDTIDYDRIAFMEDFGLEDYNGLGKVYWRDVDQRIEVRWWYDKNIVNLEQSYINDNYYKIKECEDLLNFIGAIYYDIALSEMIEGIKNTFIVRNKYIKEINIYIEPSLISNINYECFVDFNREANEMPLSHTWNQVFKENKWSKSKIIKNSLRFDAWQDFVEELPYLNDFDLYLTEFNLIKEYDWLHQREEFRIKAEFERKSIFEQSILKNDLILIWSQILHDRFWNSNNFLDKNIQYKHLNYKWINETNLKKNKIQKPLVFLNIVKWSWKQWLHMDLIEKEKWKIYKKNTIVLNERYNIWCLKLVPIRIKLPVKLKIDIEQFKNNLKYGKAFTLHYSRHIIPFYLTNKYMKDFFIWQSFRKYLAETYQEKTEEAFLWILDPEDKKNFKKAKWKHRYFLKAMMSIYTYYNMISLKSLLQVSFDLLNYHKEWERYENFDLGHWISLRLRSNAREDLNTKKFMDNYKYIYGYTYNPERYWKLFSGSFKYKILKYIAIISWIYFFHEIFYCPGEFLYNMWYVFTSGFLGLYTTYLWFYIRSYVNEDLKGKDIYLYKYKSIQKKQPLPIAKFWFNYSYKQWKKMQNNLKFFKIGEQNTWRIYRSAYIKNKFNTFKKETVIPVFIFSFFFTHWYYWELWRLGNWRGFDFYKDYESEYILGTKIVGTTNYMDIVWRGDSLDRLESGGNLYSIWYLNVFRKNKNKNLWKLDPWEEGLKNWNLERFLITYRDVPLGKISRREEFYGVLNMADVYRYIVSYKAKEAILNMSTYKKITRNQVYDPYEIHVGKIGYIDGLKYENAYKVRNILGKTVLKQKEKDMRNYWLNDVDILEFTEFYHDFIVRCKKETIKLINDDKKKYFLKDEIIELKKRNSYNSGNQMNLEIILNMSEHEKNINIFMYNLLKYKVYKHFLKKFKNTESMELYINRISNSNIDNILKLENIENILDKDKWNIIFERICKMNKYIKNLDCEYNKLTILKNLYNQKVTNFFDIYEKMIQLGKLLNYWFFEDIIQICKLIIKLFF